MSFIKVQGVVIKAINYNEYDKIITIFSDKLGKIDVVCHGARRTKSKILHITQQFCYGEYILTKGRDMYSLSSGTLIESFQGIIHDFDKLAYGSYFMEFVDKTCEKDNKNVSILALLLKTFYILDSRLIDLHLLKITFDFKITSLLGYTPQVLRCIKCGDKNFEQSYFAIEDGGFICDKCSRNKINFNKEEIDALKKIRNIKLEELGKINIDKSVQNKIDKKLGEYIDYHLSLKLNSTQFLNIFK